MARVHGGEKVETFRATNLTQDDPVRTHTQGVLHEVANGDGAFAFQVRRPGFQRQPVRLLQTKLGGVLDGQHTLAGIDHLRHGVEHGRFTRTRTAGNHHVEAAGTGDLERRTHIVGHRAKALHHVQRDRLLGEFTNRDRGALEAERRNDDVHTRTVLETGVSQRRGLVNAAADLVHDTLGDLEKMLFIAELNRRDFELTLDFDVGLFRTVDHDIRNIRVLKQFLEGTKAEKFVDENLFQSKLLTAVERQFQLGQHFHDDRAEFFGQLFLVERGCRFGIYPFQQSRKDLFLDFVYRCAETFILVGFLLNRIGAFRQPRHGVTLVRGSSTLRFFTRKGNRIDRRKLLSSSLVFRCFCSIIVFRRRF